MEETSVGVVTVSRGRPQLLRRAMASVYAQDFDGQIEQVIVVDDDPETVRVALAAPARPGLRVTVHPVRRPAAEANEPPGDRRGAYPRLSRLFNTGIQVSSAEWIAFLDDDNEFEPHHLSSLVPFAIDNGLEAAHSCRTIWNFDGSPFLDEAWHTISDPQEAARVFQVMCANGVRVPGTNIVLDRADPLPPGMGMQTSSVLQAGQPVSLVDQSTWLVRRDVLLRFPIPDAFTEADHQANTAPDDKLLQNLRDNGVRIVSNGQPTVRYYLGGISNAHQSR